MGSKRCHRQRTQAALATLCCLALALRPDAAASLLVGGAPLSWRRHRAPRVLARAAEEAADFDIDWLALNSTEERTDAEPREGSRSLPVFLAADVFVPTDEVLLKVASPADCRLYENLLLAGGRLVLTSLQRADSVAAMGTLLYLEDLRDISKSTEGQAKYVAEHRAVGRGRLLGLRRLPKEEGGYLVGDVEVLEDTSPASSSPADELSGVLSELAALQQRSSGPRSFDAPAAELRSALVARPTPPDLEKFQGLWRGASGARIRLDGDEAVGLGKIKADGDEVVMTLTSGSVREFRATAEEVEEGQPATVLKWDDKDVWTRLAAPPPYSFLPFGAAGLLWRAIRRWRGSAAWRARALRGEAQFRSAASIAENLRGVPDQAAAEAAEWERTAGSVDAAAEGMRWEEILGPCQALLQAANYEGRLTCFRAVLAMEAAKLQLRLAVEEAKNDGSSS